MFDIDSWCLVFVRMAQVEAFLLAQFAFCVFVGWLLKRPPEPMPDRTPTTDPKQIAEAARVRAEIDRATRILPQVGSGTAKPTPRTFGW